MFESLLKYRKALASSVLFHIAIIIVIVINFKYFDKPEPIQVGTQVKPIEIKIIDFKQLEGINRKKKLERVWNEKY